VFGEKLPPPSHLSLPDGVDFGWIEEKFTDGFQIFKLKGRTDIAKTAARALELIAHFGAHLKLRIDFNECLDSRAFREFIGLLGERSKQLDFVEDPVPYDGAIWKVMSEETGVELAVDRASESAREGYAIRVAKPAWEPRLEVQRSRVVFTSAMDHPLGQLFAAAEAANYAGEVDECGLLTHWLFDPDEFLEALEVRDRRLVPPAGTGLGFDELLDALPWRKL